MEGLVLVQVAPEEKEQEVEWEQKEEMEVPAPCLLSRGVPSMCIASRRD